MMASVTTNVMAMVVDGALRAAQLVPLVFTLGALQPAAAQLPRPVVAAAAPAPVMATAPAARTVVLDARATMEPLQLAISHVDVQVTGARALVRTTLIYRNDGTVPVDAVYAVPLPALFAAPGEPLEHLGMDEAPDGCGDEPEALAQFAEAGESLDTRVERGSVTVAPGEEVTVVLAREVDLVSRGDRHRLVLPLDFQRGASFTPHFSAEFDVTADRPVLALTSATHGGTASGTGSTRARLVIPEGRVAEGQFLAVDFEVGAGTEVAQATAAEADTPVRNAAAWGGEGRGLVRTTFMAAAR